MIFHNSFTLINFFESGNGYYLGVMAGKWRIYTNHSAHELQAGCFEEQKCHIYFAPLLKSFLYDYIVLMHICLLLKLQVIQPDNYYKCAVILWWLVVDSKERKGHANSSYLWLHSIIEYKSNLTFIYYSKVKEVSINKFLCYANVVQ